MSRSPDVASTIILIVLCIHQTRRLHEQEVRSLGFSRMKIPFLIINNFFHPPKITIHPSEIDVSLNFFLRDIKISIFVVSKSNLPCREPPPFEISIESHPVHNLKTLITPNYSRYPIRAELQFRDPSPSNPQPRLNIPPPLGLYIYIYILYTYIPQGMTLHHKWRERYLARARSDRNSTGRQCSRPI